MCIFNFREDKMINPGNGRFILTSLWESISHFQFPNSGDWWAPPFQFRFPLYICEVNAVNHFDSGFYSPIQKRNRFPLHICKVKRLLRNHFCKVKCLLRNRFCKGKRLLHNHFDSGFHSLIQKINRFPLHIYEVNTVNHFNSKFHSSIQKVNTPRE